MHCKQITLGLLAALAGMVSAEGESDVHQLTQDTFADFVKANDLVLAECKSPSHRALPPCLKLTF